MYRVLFYRGLHCSKGLFTAYSSHRDARSAQRSEVHRGRWRDTHAHTAAHADTLLPNQLWASSLTGAHSSVHACIQLQLKSQLKVSPFQSCFYELCSPLFALLFSRRTAVTGALAPSLSTLMQSVLLDQTHLYRASAR